MKYVLEIECDNAAFEGDNLNLEVARLLQLAARNIEIGRDNIELFDCNGNNIGRAFLTPYNLTIR